MKTTKIYLGRYQSAYNKIKIGKTDRGVGTRATEISKQYKLNFAPLVYAEFELLNGAEAQYVESALRYYLAQRNDIDFIEGSNDHLKLLRKFEKMEFLNIFSDFINTLPGELKDQLIGIKFYSKKVLINWLFLLKRLDKPKEICYYNIVNRG